ncbi:MAG: hypothetical protein WA446_12580 [Steroidobacteraceae bacterium]
MKADIAREPLQNLRQLIRRAARQRRRHDHQLDQQLNLDAEHPAAAAVKMKTEEMLALTRGS